MGEKCEPKRSNRLSKRNSTDTADKIVRIKHIDEQEDQEIEIEDVDEFKAALNIGEDTSMVSPTHTMSAENHSTPLVAAVSNNTPFKPKLEEINELVEDNVSTPRSKKTLNLAKKLIKDSPSVNGMQSPRTGMKQTRLDMFLMNKKKLEYPVEESAEAVESPFVQPSVPAMDTSISSVKVELSQMEVSNFSDTSHLVSMKKEDDQEETVEHTSYDEDHLEEKPNVSVEQDDQSSGEKETAVAASDIPNILNKEQPIPPAEIDKEEFDSASMPATVANQNKIQEVLRPSANIVEIENPVVKPIYPAHKQYDEHEQQQVAQTFTNKNNLIEINTTSSTEPAAETLALPQVNTAIYSNPGKPKAFFLCPVLYIKIYLYFIISK